MDISNINHSITAPLVWVIDDDVALRMILEDTLNEAGFEIVTFGQAHSAWEQLNQLSNAHEITRLPSVIVTDIRMPMMNGLLFSEKVHEAFSHIPIIIMTAHADVQSAVDSYQTGAFDYLPKPFELDDAIHVVQKAWQQSLQNNRSALSTTQAKKNFSLDVDTNASLYQHDKLTNEIVVQEKTPANNNPSGIIGQSVAMQKVFRAIGRLSHMPMTVLITGESGSGKELIASALHEHSPRKNKPFIALNMAAIPHDLIEAELFGHEKGAFTGATTTRQGRFEQAHGGTLFLDEIGDMPLPTQTRLLRVLANGEFFRVGGQKPIKVDVRIIAATHQHLEDLVKQGKFREDLFYRLNVIRLALPALRERAEDIPLLIEFFMRKIAKSMNVPAKTLTPQTLQILQHYDWRGNVRQLENTCQWLTVMTTGQTIQPNDLPPEIIDFYEDKSQQVAVETPNPSTLGKNNTISFDDHLAHIGSSATAYDITQNNDFLSVQQSPNYPTNSDWLTPLQYWAEQALLSGQNDILQQATPLFEKCLLEVALQHTGQHKGKAAELLGWGRNTVTRKYQHLIQAKP